MGTRTLVGALAVCLWGCSGSPTEPNEPKTRPGAATSCPKAYQDEYGFCMPAPNPPPCTYRDEHGNPFPNCVTVNPPGTDTRPAP